MANVYHMTFQNFKSSENIKTYPTFTDAVMDDVRVDEILKRGILIYVGWTRGDVFYL